MSEHYELINRIYDGVDEGLYIYHTLATYICGRLDELTSCNFCNVCLLVIFLSSYNYFVECFTQSFMQTLARQWKVSSQPSSRCLKGDSQPNTNNIIVAIQYNFRLTLLYIYMTDYFLNVPSQIFPVPKSHSLNFNVLSSVIDSSGEEV